MGQLGEIVPASEKAKEVTSLAVDKVVETAKKESGSTVSAIKSFVAGDNHDTGSAD